MSFVNRIFSGKTDLLNEITNQLTSNGWTLQYSGFDNGDTFKNIMVFRNDSDRFSIGFSYNTSNSNDFDYNPTIGFNIMINYNESQYLTGQTDGANDGGKVIAVNAHKPFIGNISITNNNLIINLSQASIVMNLYIGSLNSYKPALLNNEDLVIMAQGVTLDSTTKKVKTITSDNFISSIKAYSNGSWTNQIKASINGYNMTNITPNSLLDFTFFPIIIYDITNKKALGELKNLSSISSFRILPGFTFTYDLSDYSVINSGDFTEYYLAIKTN